MTDAAVEAGIPSRTALAVIKMMAQRPKADYPNTRVAERLGVYRTATGRAFIWLLENKYVDHVGFWNKSRVYRLTPDGIALAALVNGEVVPELEPEPSGTEIAELRAMVESLNGKMAQLTYNTSGQVEPDGPGGFTSQWMVKLQTIEEAGHEVVQIMDWVVEQGDRTPSDKIKVLTMILQEAGKAQLRALNQETPTPKDLAIATGDRPALVPVPDPPEPNGKDCESCYTSDHDCMASVRHNSKPCCSRCRFTATHGQNDPGYVAPQSTPANVHVGGRGPGRAS
jgi:hypothetical protein